MASKPLKGSQPYLNAARTLIREHRCTVCAISPNASGWAYARRRAIEVPHPRGPRTFVALAHEVGHQALHRRGLQPGHRRPQRWVEEMEAYVFAIEACERFSLPDGARMRKMAGERTYPWFWLALEHSAVPRQRRRQMLERSPEWMHDYIPKLHGERVECPWFWLDDPKPKGRRLRKPNCRT
jgi:hypothetical protein